MTSCIAVENYGHPGSHPPSIITQDENNRFVTDDQIAAWNGMSTHQDIVTGNPHAVTADDVGLGNCDNTSDADKPLSTADQAALNAKVDVTVFDAHSHYELYNPTKTILAMSVDSSGNVRLQNGVAINEFSDDQTMAGESSYAVPTEKAVVGYVGSMIAAAKYTYLTSPDGSPSIAFSVDVAGRVSCLYGTGVNRFSDDATLSGNSDYSLVTERAIKSYLTNTLASLNVYKLGTPDGGELGALVIDNTGRARFPSGVSVNRFSSDGTLSSNSNDYLPTEAAVKTFVETSIATAHPAGVTQTLTFGGGAAGDVATMTINKGVVTAVTLVP